MTEPTGGRRGGARPAPGGLHAPARATVVNLVCGGPPIFTSVKAVAGNGPYASDLFTPVASGTYQWVAAYNTWISAASTKTILVRTPALINDPTGLYTEYDVRSHVQSR